MASFLSTSSTISTWTSLAAMDMRKKRSAALVERLVRTWSLAPLIVYRDSDLRSRLRRLGKQPASQEVETEDAEFPHVFLPLVHEDCTVGVLSVNRFVDAPNGRKDEEQPEAGVVPYLQSVIKSLGAAIYLKRRSYTLYQLQSLAQELPGFPVRGANPVEKEREMLRDTLSTHFNLTVAQLEGIYAHIESQEQEDEDDARKIQQVLELEGSTRAINAASSVPESEKRRLQSKRTASKYFKLLLSQADDLPAKLDEPRDRDGSRVSNEKYVSHALSVFLGSKTNHSCAIPSLGLRNSSVFLTSANLPQFHASCELNYITRVSEILSKLMDDLHQRVERSRARVRALEAFESTCEQAIVELRAELSIEAGSKDSRNVATKHTLTPDEELVIEGVLVLQRKVIALIESVFYKTNVYVGLLEPSLWLIRFTSASESSVVKGKQLKRGYGVSFQALDAQAPVVITQKVAYDLEFMKSILPLVNGLIVQVNIRIEGIVARRRALKQIDQLCRHLDELSPQIVLGKLHETVKEVLEHISEDLSQGDCDVYMGEREIGGEKLTFTGASSESLMENISLSLSDEAN